MEAGEAGSVRATATGPPGALWWVSGTAPHAARHPRFHSASAGRGWRCSQQRSSALALGPTAQAGLCPRPGNLACVSARDTTPHRRHHPWTGDPEDPAPSATLCSPTSHHPRACLPSHRRGGLSLRPRSLWAGLWPGGCAAVRPRGAIVACAHGKQSLAGQPGRWRTPRQGAHGAYHACGTCFKIPAPFKTGQK